MLTRSQATLPSHWYYDPAHYERELDAVWYRDRACVDRVGELPRRGDFPVASVGTQSLIATRDSETWRRRGSAFCTTAQ